jgi:hypothetical protein
MASKYAIIGFTFYYVSDWSQPSMYIVHCSRSFEFTGMDHWTINNWKANSYDEGLWFVEASARGNQLSKELRRVSRSEKNRSKVCSRAKICKKNTFPWEYNNDWDSNQVFRLVPSKEFCFCILKKWRKFERAEGNLALQLK